MAPIRTHPHAWRQGLRIRRYTEIQSTFEGGAPFALAKVIAATRGRSARIPRVRSWYSRRVPEGNFISACKPSANCDVICCTPAYRCVLCAHKHQHDRLYVDFIEKIAIRRSNCSRNSVGIVIGGPPRGLRCPGARAAATAAPSLRSPTSSAASIRRTGRGGRGAGQRSATAVT